jgi:His/Glu/Gln/Arg/opine family amino acid ABC transporter permease subunit
MASYDWNFGVVRDALPELALGAGWTILLAVLTFAGSVVLGLTLCLLRISGRRWISWPALCGVEFLRLTPLLVQIFLVYYGLPLVGLVLSPFWSGVVALALNGAAFTCEIFRSGFTTIDPGQREAAEALGMSRWQVSRRVLIPIATRRVIAPLGTSWITSFQDTSLVAMLGVAELLHTGQILSTETLRPVEVFTVVGIIYFLLAYPQARLVEWLQRRGRLQS